MNALNTLIGLRPMEFMGMATFAVLGVALVVVGAVQAFQGLRKRRRWR